MIHDDFGQSLEDLLRSQSSDLPKNSLYFEVFLPLSFQQWVSHPG